VISYGGNFYSVPAKYAARRHLRVEVSPTDLAIYHNAERIAVHRLCSGRHHRIIDPKHLEGLVVPPHVTPLQHKLRELRGLGPVATAFIDGLVRTQTRLLPWHVGRLRETLFKVGPEMLQEAMGQASRFQAFDVRTVQNLCRKMRLRRFGGDGPVPIGSVLANLVTRLGEGHVLNRSLHEYETAHRSVPEV
jgi:hypothetical protein